MRQWMCKAAAQAGLASVWGIGLLTAGCDVAACYTRPRAVLSDGRAVEVMKWKQVQEVCVPGNPEAARLSERSPRKETRFIGEMAEPSPLLRFDLQMAERRALSEKESPEGAAGYVKFQVSVTNVSEQPVALDRLVVLNGQSFPFRGAFRKSGNTDGAVMVFEPEETASESRGLYWVAVEHPMTQYTWTADKEQICSKRLTYAMSDLMNLGDQKGVFWVPIRVTAETVRLTLSYTSGNRKACFYKVEAVEPKSGSVLAADTHAGESGTRSKNNTYTLAGLTPGQTLVLRVWAGTDGAGVSNGALTLVGAEPEDRVTVEMHAQLTAEIPVGETLSPGQTLAVTAVVGDCAEKSQLRRAFNAYLNAERAHPYRVLPHYNSWYDLCINRNDKEVKARFSEAEALASMRAFRTELYEKRGVFINSYLWDDGWDEWHSLWNFNANFPQGFTRLAEEAHRVKGASIGCWMSPYGGYGRSFAQRLAYAKSKGIVDAGATGLQLAKPTYYRAFRDRVLDMIARYDMNLFKFDRMGSGADANGAHARYAADLRAVGRLCREMRAAKRDVFINCTVGTWASPYWLMWCDSIWRGDGDCDWLGNVGTPRQKWLTYRDNIIHDRIASKAPFFPLNSLMMHGIIVCPSSPMNTMRDYRGTGPYVYDGESYGTPTACVDFASEVWMSVALGTGLQEYYISPNLMSKTWWDILAEGVKWLKKQETVLIDSHWIGGDPADGPDLAKRSASKPAAVYGYASFKGREGIVILRNPSDQPQSLQADLAGWLELPPALRTVPVTCREVFNSTAAYENALRMKPFEPTWPATPQEKPQWRLPPFAVLLFEVTL